MEPYHFFSEVVVIVSIDGFRRHNVKLYLTAANAIVTSNHIPGTAIRSVVLASTGTTLWLGQGHPDYGDERCEVLGSREFERREERGDVVTERAVWDVRAEMLASSTSTSVVRLRPLDRTDIAELLPDGTWWKGGRRIVVRGNVTTDGQHHEVSLKRLKLSIKFKRCGFFIMVGSYFATIAGSS